MSRAVTHFAARMGLIVAMLASLPLASQEPSAPPAPPGSRTVVPPPFPVPTPPTEIFRRLLAAGPSERESILKDRQPAQREVLSRKLAEYEAMPREQSEFQLRSLELRWYLRALLNATPTNRAEWLAKLPARERRLLRERLMYWDFLPSGLQQEVLTNELAIRLAMPAELGVPVFAGAVTNLPPAQRQKIEGEIAHWKSLPTNVQQTVYYHFRQLFTLPPPTPNFVIAPNLPPTPKPLADTLDAFKHRPKAERQSILGGYTKYTELSPRQRDEFLVGLNYWQAMSEAEREKWRQAAKRRPPPVPPPPLPSGSTSTRVPLLPPSPIQPAAAATN